MDSSRISRQQVVKRVFLSSTARDLASYREAVHIAINRLEGYKCVRMEDFGAVNWSPDKFCRMKVATCDLFIGILGHLYGANPDDCEQSYTELEFAAAVELDKPRLMFLAPEDFLQPANLREPDEKWKKQRTFRQRASEERIRDTFTSPDDLKARVVQAIRNWEQEESCPEHPMDYSLKERVRPLPPQSYYAYPYPLQKNFTGRVRERHILTRWLTGGDATILVLLAMGGMGKSALTWAWVRRDVLGIPLPGIPQEDAAECQVPEGGRPQGVLWWSFYERDASFESFVDEALAYVSGGAIDPQGILSYSDKVKALIHQLEQGGILIVLDGFERVLRAYASLGAVYQGDAVCEDERSDFRACANPHAADFLRRAAAVPMTSRVLLTTRLFPRELDGLPGCQNEKLREMELADVARFFRSQKIRGTRAEVEEACKPHGYLPLAVRLLAGIIAKDKKMPGDIRVVEGYPITDKLKGKEHHHILHVAYEAMDLPKRELLSRISAFRSPMTYDALTSLNPFEDRTRLDSALDELVERGLLLVDTTDAVYDLHPVVRQYAYERLASKEEVHRCLQGYYATASPTAEKQTIQNFEELSILIELYHHTLRTGQFDQACNLYRDRLKDPMYLRFGAYRTCIELLRELFPAGEDAPPQLRQTSDQAWVLYELANSYSRSGQSRRAAPLFQRQNDLCKAAEDRRNLAIGLGMLADEQVRLGEFEKAEGNFRLRIQLSHAVGDEVSEALGRQDIGRLLAFQGDSEGAAAELDAAEATFQKLELEHWEGQVWAYRAHVALLTKDMKMGLDAARQALKLASVRQFERDIIRAKWLLGWALIEVGRQNTSHIIEAEYLVNDALIRCRRINFIRIEPDIILTQARWHRVRGNAGQAKECAYEALAIADRCEYRLRQADIHNFLARLALEGDDCKKASHHAETARERAQCDGTTHCYRSALNEANELLSASASQ